MRIDLAGINISHVPLRLWRYQFWHTEVILTSRIESCSHLGGDWCRPLHIARGLALLICVSPGVQRLRLRRNSGLRDFGVRTRVWERRKPVLAKAPSRLSCKLQVGRRRSWWEVGRRQWHLRAESWSEGKGREGWRTEAEAEAEAEVER